MRLSSGSRIWGADLVALLCVQAALGVAFLRAIPLLEAPDEQSHLHYAAFLAWHERLPGTRDGLDVPGEGMQPPLYYAWLAPWLAALAPHDEPLLDELRRISLFTYHMRDRRALIPLTRFVVRPRMEQRRFQVHPELDRLRQLRLATLPFALLASGFTFAAALRASGSRPLALLATSLLVLTPQFVFVSSYLNNDAAAVALGAASLWLFVRCAQRRQVTLRDYLVAALLFALGALTKYSSLPVLGVTCAALPLVDARPLRARLADAGVAGALLAVALLGVAVLNHARFGEPTGTAAIWQSAAALGTPANYGGLFRYLTDRYVVWTFHSYWAVFGWMSISAAPPVYIGCFALVWTGLLGFTLGAWRPAAAAAEPAQPDALRSLRWLRRYLTAAVLATWFTHLWLNTRTAAAQGRHLYAAAPHLACMLALGIAWLASGNPLRVGWTLALAFAVGLVALSAYCLLAVIAPVYA